jgi:hypothetical protein
MIKQASAARGVMKEGLRSTDFCLTRACLADDATVDDCIHLKTAVF